MIKLRPNVHWWNHKHLQPFSIQSYKTMTGEGSSGSHKLKIKVVSLLTKLRLKVTNRIAEFIVCNMGPVSTVDFNIFYGWLSLIILCHHVHTSVL